MEIVHQFVCRTAERMIRTAVAAALAVVLLAGWFLIKDWGALASEQHLRETRRDLDGRIAALRERLDLLAVDLAGQRQEVMRSERTIRDVRRLTNTWEWFAVNRAQLAANRERLAQLEPAHALLVAGFGTLERQWRAISWECERLEIARDRVNEQLRQRATADVGAEDPWLRTWRRVRSWLLLGLAIYLVGPVLGAAAWHRWRERRAALAVFSR